MDAHCVLLVLLVISVLGTALSDGGSDDDTKFAPRFKYLNKMPSAYTKVAGSSIRLKCAAEGNPSPNITWTKNNGVIERSSFRPSYGRWWLTLEELSKTDTGNYTCLVCNELGCISRTVRLDVKERIFQKPILVRAPSNLTLPVGDTARFDCEYKSDFHHVVYWTFYMNLAEESSSGLLKSDDPTDKPEQLTIANVTRGQQGWYVCTAMNTLGTAFAAAYLTVLEPNPK